MDYTIKGGFRGKRKVMFNCPKCSFELESPLEEAGKRYPCPKCQNELIVPGVKELQKQHSEDAALAEAQSREGAKKVAEEKSREAQRVKKAKERADREAEKIRMREARRIERGNGPRTWQVSRLMFGVSLLFVIFAAVGLVYLAMIRPLQRRLAETQAQLNNLAKIVNVGPEVASRATQTPSADSDTETLNHNTEIATRAEDDLKSLTDTVNHNAEVANHAMEGLKSLSETVNHNAEVANRTTDTISSNLDSLTETVNHNAEAANRATAALSSNLDSLTDTVNHNAEIANINNSHP